MVEENIEIVLLKAMQAHVGRANTKCDQVLRDALLATGKYSQVSDNALCNSGVEEPETWLYYCRLRQLIAAGYAEGRGDLASPAGPRYTECRITPKGSARLAREIDVGPGNR